MRLPFPGPRRKSPIATRNFAIFLLYRSRGDRTPLKRDPGGFRYMIMKTKVGSYPWAVIR